MELFLIFLCLSFSLSHSFFASGLFHVASSVSKDKLVSVHFRYSLVCMLYNVDIHTCVVYRVEGGHWRTAPTQARAVPTVLNITIMSWCHARIHFRIGTRFCSMRWSPFSSIFHSNSMFIFKYSNQYDIDPVERTARPSNQQSEKNFLKIIAFILCENIKTSSMATIKKKCSVNSHSDKSIFSHNIMS